MAEMNIQAEYLEKAKKAGLTDADLAKLLGVSTRTVEAWRSGDTRMPKSARIICVMMEKDPMLVLKTAATITG